MCVKNQAALIGFGVVIIGISIRSSPWVDRKCQTHRQASPAPALGCFTLRLFQSRDLIDRGRGAAQFLIDMLGEERQEGVIIQL